MNLDIMVRNFTTAAIITDIEIKDYYKPSAGGAE
jgi:hypothetical protein